MKGQYYICLFFAFLINSICCSVEANDVLNLMCEPDASTEMASKVSEKGKPIKDPEELYNMAMYYYTIDDDKNGNIYLRKSMEAGYSLATYEMGYNYFYGEKDFPRDSIKAIGLFKKSAEQGCFEGCAVSGDFSYNANDTIMAFRYWEMAVNIGSQIVKTADQTETMGRISYLLGYHLYYGIAQPQNTDLAIYYFEEAGKNGNADALYILGLLYHYESNYVVKNDTIASLAMLMSALKGNIEAEAVYGDYCNMGIGMERDSLKSIIWYKKAALDGHAGAMVCLADRYYYAQDNDSTILWGTRPECRDSAYVQYLVANAYYNKEDYKNAEIWWQKSGSRQYPESYWMLYVINSEIKEDSVAGFKYLKQAAELGLPEAICDMGTNYITGDMVDKDIEKGREMYLKAAEGGYGLAYNNLGVLYSEKEYTKKPNWKLAADYYRQGAELGCSEAQYNFGMCLKRGKGVKKDKNAAVSWLTLAAKNGNEDAIKEIEKMGIH